MKRLVILALMLGLSGCANLDTIGAKKRGGKQTAHAGALTACESMSMRFSALLEPSRQSTDTRDALAAARTGKNSPSFGEAYATIQDRRLREVEVLSRLQRQHGCLR